MRRLSLAPLVVVVLLLPVALTLGMLGVGPLAIPAAGPVAKGETAALVWSGRAFTSKQGFAAFLRSKGGSYERWAARHPGIAPWDPAPRASSSRSPAATAPKDGGRADPAAVSRPAGAFDWLGRFLLVVTAAAALIGVGRLARVRGFRPSVRRPSLSLAVSFPKVRAPAVPSIRPRAAVALETAAAVSAATARAVARGCVLATDATTTVAARLRDAIDERELPMYEIGLSVAVCIVGIACGALIALLLAGSY
jgi:hypothetical protein